MNYVSEKMKGKTPYTPIEGNYTVRLDANESPFDLPDAVKQALAKELFRTPLDRYPDPSARTVREAFARRYGVDPERVVVGNGSDELISLIMTSLLDKGDTLAVPVPEFSMYAFYAELTENKVLTYEKPADYTLDGLLDFVKENRCRAVVFSNPCNPTGGAFDRKTVLSFVRNCPALCIVDEAYMDFWDQSVLDVAADFENLIVLRTLSKAYGAAGIRCGFAVGHKSLINALNVARSPYNVNTLTQTAARLVLEIPAEESPAPFLARQAEKLADALRELLPDATVYPTHTNFVFLQSEHSQALFTRLAECGIAVRYFAPQYLRITASTDEEMNLLFSGIREVLS